MEAITELPAAEYAAWTLADLAAGRIEQLREALGEMHPAEVAGLLLAAAVSGIGVPLLLRRMGIDPALSGAVILTTVTDLIGFLSFLGLASAFLL